MHPEPPPAEEDLVQEVLLRLLSPGSELYEKGEWTVWDPEETVTIVRPNDPSNPIVRPISIWEVKGPDEAVMEAGGLDAYGNPQRRIVRISPDTDPVYGKLFHQHKVKTERIKSQIRRTILDYL